MTQLYYYKMNEISNTFTSSYIFDKPYQELHKLLSKKKYSQVFVLVDENTEVSCLPKFKKNVPDLVIKRVFKVEIGEASKSFDTCVQLWTQLADNDADRYALLINLGGGMVTDLGGFVASTYKRGIDFINIPTSLLAMVDASIGGKTGVNLHHLKNQIGTIQLAKLVLFDFGFLQTLPESEVRSGFAEILKHGLIADLQYWKEITDYESILQYPESMIKQSVSIKSQIVEQDPMENGLRKHLNFGHTLGHAIESYFRKSTDSSLLHGEAVAHGMILESYLSYKVSGLSEKRLSEIANTIQKHFLIKNISFEQQKDIIELLRFDKKNRNGQVRFVLLQDIGLAQEDYIVDEEAIKESFNYMNNF